MSIKEWFTALWLSIVRVFSGIGHSAVSFFEKLKQVLLRRKEQKAAEPKTGLAAFWERLRTYFRIKSEEGIGFFRASKQAVVGLCCRKAEKEPKVFRRRYASVPKHPHPDGWHSETHLYRFSFWTSVRNFFEKLSERAAAAKLRRAERRELRRERRIKAASDTSYQKMARVGTFFKKYINYILPAAAGVAAVCFVLSFDAAKFGLVISINGKELGMVDNTAEYREAVHNVNSQVASITGHSYELDAQVSYRLAPPHAKMPKVSMHDMTRELFSLTGDAYFDGHGVYVDDQFLGAVRDPSSINEFLEDYLNEYRKGVTEGTVAYLNDIRIVHQLYASELETEPSRVCAVLNSKKVEQKTYAAQRGDSYYTIAKRFGMTIAELEAINPDFDARSLLVGQELIIERPEPFLSVKVIKEITYTKDIPYGTTTQKTSSRYSDYSKVKSKGVKGKEEIRAEVVMVDGVEIERTVLETQVLKKPVDQVILKGTKKLPSKAPSGSFVIPCPQYRAITSRYGPRRSRGDFHTGLDFGAPRGTSILAADGGKVVFAGRRGGYGKLVIIDHGKGVETYYAHQSQILVKKGDSVYQGQKIGEVGSTGNSTGNHLHFEIRFNGHHVNPEKYISLRRK